MLKDQLMTDIKTAMKAGNQAELTTLRGLMAVLKNAEIAKQMKNGASAALTDEESIGFLLTEAKKRKDAIAAFQGGGRPELAKAEEAELGLLGRYLPTQLSSTEVEKEIDQIIAGSAVKEFGPVMKAAMTQLRGKADGQLVTDIVKKKLAS